MNAKQFATALDRLNLSHSRAARVLGIARSSVIRYANGEYVVPVSLQRLIEMYIRHGVPKEFA
jgi:predicted XRE-type DNA-binding protein